MSEEAAEFAALAEDLLRAGRVDDLVTQLADPDMVGAWDDPAVLAVLAEAHGRHAATSALMDVALLRGPGAALLLPAPGAIGPAARLVDGRVELDGVVRGDAATVHVVVPLGPDVVRLDRDAVTVAPVRGLDPDLALSRVTGSVPADDGEALPVASAELVAGAARFLAHELVGVAEGALAVASAHVRDRHQFGVPIGSFQAVRHRLADAYVQTTAARELLAALPGGDDVDLALLVLKAGAGTAACTAVAAAQQVCGGMGFTLEFGLHRFVRRALVLDAWLVGSEDADEQLGRLALAGRVVPDRQVVLS